MFTFIKETELEDLGAGVSRRILAHDGNMMAVEVHFEQALSAQCIITPTNN